MSELSRDLLTEVDMLRESCLAKADRIDRLGEQVQKLLAENRKLTEANERFSQRQEWWTRTMFELEQERDAMKAVLKEVGLFLHHCWCDVQMNDHSFGRLNDTMTSVDHVLKNGQPKKGSND